MKKLLLFILILCFCSFLLFAEETDDIEKLLYKAQQSIASKSYASAIRYLEKVIEIDDESYDGNYLLGYALYKKERYSEAIKYLEEAFDIKKSYDSGLLLAESFQKSKKWKDALKMYDELLKLKSTEMLLIKKAEVYLDMGEKESAITIYKNLLLKKEELPIYIRLIKIYLNSKQYNKAREYVSKAEKIAPHNKEIKNISYFLNVSINLDQAERSFKAKKYHDALGYYNKVLKADTKNYQALIRKANILLLTENYNDALKTVKDANRFYKNRSQIYKLFGLIYNKKGDYQKAIKYLRKAEKLSPKDYQLFYQLGYSYEHLSLIDEAIKAYNKCIRFNRNFSKVYIGLTRIYIKKKDYEKAEKMLTTAEDKGEKNLGEIIKKLQAYKNIKKADELFDKKKYKSALDRYSEAANILKSAEIYINMANCSVALNKLDDALQFLSKSEQIDPNNYIIYQQRASIYKEKKDNINYKKAVAKLEKLKASNPEIWLSIGYANELNGDFKEAEKSYRKALKIDKKNKKARLQLANLLYNIAVKKFNAEKLDDAISYSKKCLKIMPDYSPANEVIQSVQRKKNIKKINLFISSAEKNYNQGNYGEAIRLFQKVLDLKPDLKSIKSKLAYTYYIIGRDEDALNLVEKIEDDPLAMELKSKLYLDKNKPNKAKDYALLSLKLKETASIYNLLGKIYFKLNERDRAIGYFKKAASIKKDDLKSSINLGNLYFSESSFDLAEIQYLKVLKKAPTNPVALHNLGVISFKRNKLKESLKYFKKALKYEKKYYGIYFGLGRTEYYLKDYKNALKHIKLAMKLKKDISFDWALGVIYSKLARKNAKFKPLAIKHLKLCVENKQNDEISVKARKYLVSLLKNKRLFYKNRYPFKTVFKPVIAGEQLFYYSGIMNKLICKNFEGENILWQNFLVAKPKIQYVYSDNLYYLDVNNILYCIDPYNGGIIWRTHSDIVKLFPSSDKGIFAIDKNKELLYFKNKKEWSVKLGAKLNTAKISLTDYKNNLLLSKKDTIIVIDKNNGKIKWRLPANIVPGTKFSVAGAMFQGTYTYPLLRIKKKKEYLLCCVDENNKLVWKKRIKSMEDLATTPILNSDRIMVLFKDGTIQTFNRKGKYIWYKNLKSKIKSSAVQNNKLVVITEDEHITGINILNGRIAWKSQLKPEHKKNQYLILYIARE